MNASKKLKLASMYKVCPHCDKNLNMKTYKEHKRLYFDDQLKVWHCSPESDSGDSDSTDISQPDSVPNDSDSGESWYTVDMNDVEPQDQPKAESALLRSSEDATGEHIF